MAAAAAALVDLAQQPADEGAMPDTPEADNKKMITVWYASKPPARDKAWRGTVTKQTEEEFTVRFDDLASDDEQKEMPVHISLDEWAWGHHTKKATVKAADRRVSPKGKAPASGTPAGPPEFKRQAFGAPGAAVSFGLASLDADVLALTVSFVDTSLDDLAALRASFRLLRTCKTINLAIANATHFWQPLASALGSKLPLVAEAVADWASPAAAASSSAVAAPQGSLLDAMMRGLNGVCVRAHDSPAPLPFHFHLPLKCSLLPTISPRSQVHCRQRRCGDHPDFGVPLCALCDRKKEKTRYVYDAQGLRCAVKAGGGIMAASNAKGYHRLTDGDLKKLPHKEASWYGKASKIYCKAQVILAQDKRYGNKAAFDAVDKSRKAYNPGSYYGPDYERYGHGNGYGLYVYW